MYEHKYSLFIGIGGAQTHMATRDMEHAGTMNKIYYREYLKKFDVIFKNNANYSAQPLKNINLNAQHAYLRMLLYIKKLRIRQDNTLILDYCLAELIAGYKQIQYKDHDARRHIPRIPFKYNKNLATIIWHLKFRLSRAITHSKYIKNLLIEYANDCACVKNLTACNLHYVHLYGPNLRIVPPINSNIIKIQNGSIDDFIDKISFARIKKTCHLILGAYVNKWPAILSPKLRIIINHDLLNLYVEDEFINNHIDPYNDMIIDELLYVNRVPCSIHNNDWIKDDITHKDIPSYASYTRGRTWMICNWRA